MAVLECIQYRIHTEKNKNNILRQQRIMSFTLLSFYIYIFICIYKNATFEHSKNNKKKRWFHTTWNLTTWFLYSFFVQKRPHQHKQQTPSCWVCLHRKTLLPGRGAASLVGPAEGSRAFLLCMSCGLIGMPEHHVWLCVIVPICCYFIRQLNFAQTNNFSSHPHSEAGPSN